MRASTPNCRSVSRAAGLALLALPHAAAAFTEDVCFLPADRDGASIYYAPFDCFDLQCTDGLERFDNPAACAASGSRVYRNVTFDSTALYHRSSVHFDVVYLVGVLSGLSPDDARTVATFSESTDLGVYRNATFTSWNGSRPATAQLGPESENTIGLRRDNPEALGYWLHYVPWYREDGSTATSSHVDLEVYTPDEALAFPPQERPLNHLRAWAFTPGRQLCGLGLAYDDGTCWDDYLYGYTPVLGDAVIDDGVRHLRWQDIHDEAYEQADTASDGQDDRQTGVADYDQGDNQTGAASYDEAYGIEIAGSLKALGIYLHALSDRISHDECSDHSFIESGYGSYTDPTTGAVSDYTLQLIYDDACGSVAHGAGHYLETGHGEETPERTEVGLELQLLEMQAWAAQNYPAERRRPIPGGRGLPAPGSAAFTDEVISSILSAVSQPCTNRRLRDLCSLATSYGLEWHDGNPSCVYPSLPGDDQCAAEEPDVASPREAPLRR